MCQNIDPCLLLCPRHGDLVLLTGLDLVCEGVAQGGVLTVHKDYQLQTRGDFVVYLGKGKLLIVDNFLVLVESSCALRYKGKLG